MNLLEEMRRRRVNAMLGDASFLAGQPDSDERAEAMERERRALMYEMALGRITRSEKNVIFRILNRKGDGDASVSLDNQEVPPIR